MQLASRARRQKEFISWFVFRFEQPGNLGPMTCGEGIDRLILMTENIQHLVGKHRPSCYWCGKSILESDFDIDDDTVTLHHIDEDRSNDTAGNLELCHKTCHQSMHKLSTSVGLPTAALWSLMKKGTLEVACTRNGQIINGIGRG